MRCHWVFSFFFSLYSVVNIEAFGCQGRFDKWLGEKMQQSWNALIEIFVWKAWNSFSLIYLYVYSPVFRRGSCLLYGHIWASERFGKFHILMFKCKKQPNDHQENLLYCMSIFPLGDKYIIFIFAMLSPQKESIIMPLKCHVPWIYTEHETINKNTKFAPTQSPSNETYQHALII